MRPVVESDEAQHKTETIRPTRLVRERYPSTFLTPTTRILFPLEQLLACPISKE